MKSSRRALLMAGVGLGQLLLLDRFGLDPIPTRSARASGQGPTKLLTLFVPGGWMPVYLFCPFSATDVGRVLPKPMVTLTEPAYYDPSQLSNLDGTGDADASSPIQRLRVARMWDAQALASGQPDPRTPDPVTGIPTSPHGYAWDHHRLWENSLVLHGVDMGTNSHASGVISAMCGAPGAEYRAPGMHSVVANALFEKYKDARPLPAVAIGQAPVSNPLDLGAVGAPTVLPSLGALETLLSERHEGAWQNLRERTVRRQRDFDGRRVGEIATTDIDEYVLRQVMAQKGKSSVGTDAFLRSLHDGYQGVSKLLVRDVMSMLEKVNGVENTPTPFWAEGGHFGTAIGSDEADAGAQWAETFDLTLKLLKSDVTSAISVYCPGLNGFYYDTHGAADGVHFAKLRPIFDVVGRFLGEMKATPGPNGGTLLDDTLVVIMSEFARTWPHATEHWPTTSVVLAGGGINTNRMLGGYDVSGGGNGLTGNALGYYGKPLALVDEGGDPQTRIPKSADVAQTVYRLLGIDGIFIPGGSGEIVGVRQGT